MIIDTTLDFGTFAQAARTPRKMNREVLISFVHLRSVRILIQAVNTIVIHCLCKDVNNHLVNHIQSKY